MLRNEQQGCKFNPKYTGNEFGNIVIIDCKHEEYLVLYNKGEYIFYYLKLIKYYIYW